MSEAELLKAFIEERSDAAFAGLVRRYAALVFSTAHRRLSNATLAEDVTQTVFIRLAQKPPALRTGAELAAWLHRTTVHVTIDLWRSETRRRARELESTLMETSPSSSVLWEEISPVVDEALNELRDDDRQVLTLRFFSGKSMREVGSLLGVSEDAAKMRVSRAVERLRARLGVSATACPAAALAVLLGERAAEAAPAPLLARLVATKLPAMTAGASGLVAALLRVSKLKLAAGAVAFLVVGTTLIRAINSREANGITDPRLSNSSAPGVPQATGIAEFDRLKQMANAARSTPPVNPEPKVKMVFRVLDSQTGQALEKARVSVADFGPGGLGESHDVVTDTNGSAPIPEPDDPAKRTMNVFVVAEGHVPVAVNFRMAVMPAAYTVKLDPATSLSGTVVDDAGQSVAGVRIEVHSPGIRPGRVSRGFQGLRGLTGASVLPSLPSADEPNESIDFQLCPATNRDDGTWIFNYLPLDYTNEVTLTLSKQGYVPTQLSVPVGTLGRSNLVLVLGRGFAVSGRITDSNRAPIAAANIRILTGDRAKFMSAKSDQDGRFLMVGVFGEPAPGAVYMSSLPETNADGVVMIRGPSAHGPLQVELSIQAGGFASQRRIVALAAASDSVDLVLAPGKVFRGRVLDKSGVPIPNAVAQTDWDNQGVRKYEWTSRTDASGGFEWDSMPAEPVLFWFEADGYSPERRVELQADGTDHEIRLERSPEQQATLPAH